MEQQQGGVFVDLALIPEFELEGGEEYGMILENVIKDYFSDLVDENVSDFNHQIYVTTDIDTDLDMYYSIRFVVTDERQISHIIALYSVNAAAEHDPITFDGHRFRLMTRDIAIAQELINMGEEDQLPIEPEVRRPHQEGE